ncbi:MAG TPA: ATP-binding protein [Stellaceae bacterium]|nr:ATP-binding protein [Stellaceae bacterium]
MEVAVDDIVHVPEWAAPPSPRARQAWRAIVLSVAYVAVYVTLDRISFIEPLHGINITPWNPSTGVMLALLIIKGVRWSPLVLIAELISDATLSQIPVLPAPLFVAATVVTVGYAGAAAILRHVRFEASLRRTSDVVVLFLVASISSCLVASGFVATYAAAGVVPWTGFADAVFQYWIGDAIGIVVFAPPLLMITQSSVLPAPTDRRRNWLQLVEVPAQGASVVAALAAVFLQIGGDHPFGVFYVLFLPLIWIATRRGVVAASWALLAIQAGLIAGLEIRDQWEVPLRAFQLLMFALAATGLMLGAVVSERHRLSLALAASERRRAAILNTARDGVLTIDAHGQIQSINPAVERLFELPGNLLIGHDIHELVDAPPDLLARLRRITGAPAAEAVCWELDARRADGEVFPIELSVGRFDPPGTEQYTLVIRDIALRRKAEARVRKHQAELAHVSRVSLAGEMAAGLAHELSQPLTAITAYARGCLRLLAGSVPEPALLHEGLAEVVQQAERAGDVLDRLREFVRGGEYRRVLTKVKPLIDAAVSLTRMDAMQQKVEIAARVDPGLPAVLADRIQIQQVLLNLLRNAMDAMEGTNTARRSIAVKARRKSKHAVEISVADSGPGIADEVTDRIFEPFVTTKPLGMGMGLSISHSIVESHGGSLRMARNVPSGAIFFFDLPTAEAVTSTDAG